MDEMKFLRDVKKMSQNEFENVMFAILKHAKASDVIDALYKKASDDLPKIKCKECNYKGKTDEYGFCPKCGALMGEKKNDQENSELDNYLYKNMQADHPDSVYDADVRGRMEEY